jgi:hypothetical protein
MARTRDFLEKITRTLLQGCVIVSDSRTKMYTPDGKKSYAALWTRDFAYMVEYAGELLPKEDIEAALNYLISGVREDGWVPDRVEGNGTARYTGGFTFPAKENLDNGPFLILAVDAYLKSLSLEEAKKKYRVWRTILIQGIACLPVNKEGLIVNDTLPPHSPYGFTDAVEKTGALAMESLLLWRAVKVLAEWEKRIGNDNSVYRQRQKSIEVAFLPLFLDESGMLFSATGACHQLDLWATCYMVSIGFPLPSETKRRIALWLTEHYDGIVQNGQLRHLPAGEYWEKTFVSIQHDTYQNGAYWATPTGWLIDALIIENPALAKRTMTDVVSYFANVGVYECVFQEHRQLESYVVSATNVYGALKRHPDLLDF